MAGIQGYGNEFLSSMLRKLYLDCSTADVYFVFGSKLKDERIPAHKCLLTAGSDAFKAMFYGEMAEKSDIPIVDASVAAFQEFLQFFYRDDVQLTMENIFEVVNLANKYNVCLKTCESFLQQSLIIENACSSYGLAILFDLKDLKAACETMIAENAIAIFQTASFLDCDLAVLSHILKMDNLSCTETRVFHACMDWVKEKSNETQLTLKIVHKHLGDSLFDIRFRSMTIEEFTELLVCYGNLFSSEEYQEIVRVIVTKDFYSKRFNGNPRQIQWNDGEVIECSRVKVENGITTCSFQDIESTVFSSNAAILLGEIVCAQINLRSVGSQLATELVLIENSPNDTPKIIAYLKSTFKTGSAQVISLQRPILIRPEVSYEIQFKQTPGDSQYFPKPPKPEDKLPNTEIVVKFQDKPSYRGSYCLVAALRFNLIGNDMKIESKK